MEYAVDPKRVLAEMLRMQKLLADTDLDWTAVWPHRLTDGEATGVYRLAVNEALKEGSVVSRADLAHFMVTNIESPDYLGVAWLSVLSFRRRST